MKNNLKLKGISYSDKEINIENLYRIITDVIIENTKRGENNEQINSCIA